MTTPITTTTFLRIKTAATCLALCTSVLLAASPASAQTLPGTYASLDASRFSIVVKLTVQPDQRDAFLGAMKARIADARLHPAVVDFRILATPDPLVFMGYESFTDRTAFDEFAKTPQSQAFLGAMKAVLAKSPEATLLTPMP
jgi:quinol monooxygenase YgiN